MNAEYFLAANEYLVLASLDCSERSGRDGLRRDPGRQFGIHSAMRLAIALQRSERQRRVHEPWAHDQNSHALILHLGS